MATAGLDLCAGRATFVRIARTSATGVRLEAAAIVPLATGDDEPERAAALVKALGPGAARGAVRLGIPGKDAILRYLRLPFMPAWRLRLIMEVEVADVAEKAGEPLSSDYRTLLLPDDVAGDEGTSVIVGLAKEAAMLARVEALAARGLRVGAVMPTSVALFDAYIGLGHTDEGKTVVLLDAGPEGAELAIGRDGLLLFARGFPAQPGGAGLPLPGEAHATGRGALGQREAQGLAQATAAAIQFCRTQQKLRALPVDAVRLSGAFARSPELGRALGQALKGVEVGIFDPLERLQVDGLDAAARAAVEGRGPELALAIGLALAREHPRCVDLDLTPAPIVARRDFLSRTVFLWGAGAALAATLVVAGATAWAARGSALGRRAELARMKEGLDERQAAVDARAEANRRAIDVVDALARRTQAGAAALRLLGRLREAVPPRVTVVEVALEPPARGPGGAAPAPGTPAQPAESVHFRLRGEADNAAGDAVQLLGKLEAALREDPAVASAKVTGTPVAQPGAILEFVLSVSLRADAGGDL